jgi:hypothetical protein
MSTRRPRTAPRARKARNAVPAATGRVLACSASMPSGSVPRFKVGTALCSAQAPPLTKPTTRVPAGGPLPSAAGSITRPALSQPPVVPSGKKPSFGNSPWLSEKASTPMRASSGLGFGSGTSVSRTPDAVPESIRYARMFLLLDRAQPWLIAHPDAGGLCARCGGVAMLLVLPEEAVKSRITVPSNRVCAWGRAALGLWTKAVYCT